MADSDSAKNRPAIQPVTLNYQKKPINSDFWRLKQLIYGESKVGKTVQCSQIEPGCFFFECEPGHDWVEHSGEVVDSWEKFLGTARAVAEAKARGDFPFGVICIDTAARSYALCRDYVLKSLGALHESDEAYGKGYSMVEAEFTRVVMKLSQLGLGVIFTAHPEEKDKQSSRSKNADKWKRIDVALPKAGYKLLTGLCDSILYFENRYDPANDQYERVIHTRGTDLFFAGVRYPSHFTRSLPDTVPMDINHLAKIWNSGVLENKAQRDAEKPQPASASPAPEAPKGAPPEPAPPTNETPKGQATGTKLERRTA